MLLRPAGDILLTVLERNGPTSIGVDQMPYAARQLPQTTPERTEVAGEPSWSGETHGPVAALHRAIEERLLVGVDTMVVLPLQLRPAEVFGQAVSRMAGWGVLLGCFAAAALLLALS